MATFALTDTGLSDSLSRALGAANRVIVEDEPLVTSDLTQYFSTAGNWLATSPATVYKNGVLTSGTISLVSGTVTFGLAQVATDVITASYRFAPYGATGMSGLLADALYAIEGQLGTPFDEAVVDRGLRMIVVQQATIFALQGLQAGTLEYYRWELDRRMVDKNGVTAHYDRAIATLQKSIDSQLAYLRAQYMGHGRSVVLNIDRGQPPNRFSTYGSYGRYYGRS